MTAVILRRRGLGKATADGVCAASTKGIGVVRSWIGDWPARHNESGVMTIFRWGCTSTIPPQPANVVVVNTANAIHWCSDKRQGRLDMQAAGVPVPQTWDADEWLEETYTREEQFVVRPSSHAQGKHLLVVDGRGLNEVGVFLNQHGSGYVSRLIHKVAEYRVFVCQNRVVWVASKTPGSPTDIAWNVGNAGCFNNVRWGQWPLQVVKAALAAMKVSGADFGGVDVMVDAEDNPYVLEINSASSQTSPYRIGCLAKAFDYIIEHGKQHFDDVPDGPRRTYKSYIHPAVCASERSDPAIRPQE